MITPHLQLVNRVTQSLQMMKEPGITFDVDGEKVIMKVKSIIASASVPNAKDIPKMWHRYGIAVPNEAFEPGVNFEGKTFIAVIDIAFEKKDKFDLFQTAALYNDAMLVIADDLRLSPDSPDWGIDDVRLGVESTLDAPSTKERLRFSLEVDFYYTSEIESQ